MIRDAVTISWIDWYPHWNIQENIIVDILRLFNIRFKIIENPEDADIIFAGVYDLNLLRSRIYQRKFIVLVSGENIRPNYLYYDYSITTDSYSYSGKNIRWPEYFSQFSFDHKKEINIHLKEDLNQLAAYYRQWDDRDIMFSIIYNNACPHREHYTNLLRSKYGHDSVQSYGSSRINRDCNKYEILGRSKFHLAFENSLHPGYVTEKLFQSLLMGTFSLYWGANDVSRDIGCLGYINLAGDKFSDDDQLFDFIESFCSDQYLRDSLNRSGTSIDHLNPSLLSSILENAEIMLINIFDSLLYYKTFRP